MPQHLRIYWKFQAAGRFRLNWSAIRANSFVVVTASEGPAPRGDGGPERYIGNAYFTVSSIAPFNGGVDFFVSFNDWTKLGAWWMGGDYLLDGGLSLWTDINVFDSGDFADQISA